MKSDIINDTKKTNDSIVLDTSALLALFNNEKGTNIVKSVLPNAIMSSVNVAELVGIMDYRFNIAKQDIHDMLSESIRSVISFNATQSHIAGELEAKSRKKKLGLSLGDKCCLALAMDLGVPVYTADQAWADLDIQGIEVHLIRPNKNQASQLKI